MTQTSSLNKALYSTCTVAVPEPSYDKQVCMHAKCGKISSKAREASSSVGTLVINTFAVPGDHARFALSGDLDIVNITAFDWQIYDTQWGLLMLQPWQQLTTANSMEESFVAALKLENNHDR